MTKSEALYEWMSSFDIPAYPENAVPTDTTYPWLTFSKGSGQSYATTVHLYYHTTSEAIPDAKAEEICKALRNGGTQIPYDDENGSKGVLWLTIGSPEWFSVADADMVENKHRIINVNVDDNYYF